jgi:hypothetical protein
MDSTKTFTETKVHEIKNCTDCPFHEVQPDPDPNDWFCQDGVNWMINQSQQH